MNFVEELRWRGMLQDIMPGTEELLSKEQVTAYLGIDPTADSLHIGHLCGVMILRHFQRCGHKPLALIGGATGMIGDPSGKSAERNLLDEETLRHNQACIKKQLAKFLDFESEVPNRAELVNNYDWMKDFSFLDFVREVGKHITVNYMMAKDSVKRRLNGEARDGLSFTEFTYQLLQGYDFLHLYETKGCKLQMGGSDQWGNITAGIELIRKKTGKEAYGFTMPLLTKSDGTKFGKTNGKAIWLDREKTSPYEMYQFFINSEDDKVIDYLKFLTFLTPEEIMELEEKNKTQPHLREAHKALAREVITFLHGKEAYEEAVQVSQTLFSGQIQNLTLEQVDVAFEGVPTVETEENEMNILDVLILVGAAKSKREAREFVNGGSVLINGERIKDLEFTVKKEDAFGQSKTVIRRGKKNYFVLKYNG